MNNRVRFLNTEDNSAVYNMGMDQALMESVRATNEPVLRVYNWSSWAVTVGYFQKLQDEVDVPKSAELKVDVIRRMTGGGAVFHQNELTYSFIVPMSADFFRKPILESYEDLAGGVIEAGKIVGLNIKFVPLNDLVVGSQKISGNAQTRRDGVILQHGTLLLEVDVDKMFELLLVPDEKLKGKMIETVKERVTSISAQLGRLVGFDEMATAVLEGYKRAFPSLEFVDSEVSEKEHEVALIYARERYSNDEWNFKF